MKRHGDLEKQLPELDTEAIHEEQAFWKDIILLVKDLRYKLELYREERNCSFLLCNSDTADVVHWVRPPRKDSLR